MTARPLWHRLGLAFGLGVVMAAGQAPLGFWWATLAAMAGLVALLGQAAGWRVAALTGLFAGAGHFAAALSWIIEPFLIDAARHGWMAPFAVVLLSFGLALFWALAAGAAALAATAPRRALLFAVALTAAETLRGYLFTGFPWALPGHVWVGWAPAQLAAVAGPNGLTLLTLLLAALPVAFRVRGLALSAALLLAAFGFGLWRMAAPDLPVQPVTVRLVQPNADQQSKWDPQQARFFFDRQLALTAAAPQASGPRPDLVVWPETSVPYLLNRAEGALAEIARAAGGAAVAVGIQRTEGWRGWNSMAVIGPDAAVLAVYDKHHLVPFGEYIPYGDVMASLFGLTAFAAQEGNGYSAGQGAALLDLGRLGRVLPLICYEAVFPQDLRAAPGRADWILQITNDAWFGTLTGPYQHLAQARLRSIEQGLPMIRVANTGISAVIDARGQVLARIPLGRDAFLDTALPGALPPPFYARTGEIPVLGVLAILAALLLFRRRGQPA